MYSPLTSRLGDDRALLITALAVVVLLGWAHLLRTTHIDVQMIGGGQTMAMPGKWSLGHAAIVFVMWAIMMIAMMVPSAAKVVLLAATLEKQQRPFVAARRTGEFVAGYLAVWLAFSVVATAAQWALDEAELLSAAMMTSDRMLAGSLLLYAGIYEWSPLKQACLTHCRTPQDFLTRHWERDGPFGTGLRHGLFCLGCCWMLMTLLFVGGVMNLACIAVVAAAILAEKILPLGIWTGRLIGATLIAGGAIWMVTLA